MATQPIAEQIEQAKESVERAKVKRDRAWSRVWDLLGWGESIKLDAARKTLVNADRALAKAITQLQKLEKTDA